MCFSAFGADSCEDKTPFKTRITHAGVVQSTPLDIDGSQQIQYMPGLQVGAENLPMLHTTMRGDSLNGAITSWETPVIATNGGTGSSTEVVSSTPKSADPKHSYIVDRIALGQQMVDSAMSLYGNSICFHFDQQLLSVDFER